MKFFLLYVMFIIFLIEVHAQAPFEPLEMKPLPIGSVQATGWLKNQLQIQANGLSGHLDEFWPDIKNSGWFGGETEGWERAPYWLDGVIPLAYTLNDPALKEKVNKYLDIILKSQHEDGWLGPKPENLANYDIWSLFLALKMLTQYQEASGDYRAILAIERCLKRIDKHIGAAPLRNWAMYRWFEALIPIYWLYDRTREAWLLDLALKLRSQGFDWATFFASWPLNMPTPKRQWNFMGHVVNNAMALKAPTLWWRLSGDANDRNMVYSMMKKLDISHGMVTGVFSGDECLAGKNPSQGTELCAVVEYMYSLEMLLSILGDPTFADRLEKIAFNALPATFSPDMWSHQYDQQVNQVECSIQDNRNWTTNGPEANIFGLAPNYGCCTSNLSQGWPKFAAHLWMCTKDSGLAAVAYAPSKAITNIKDVWVVAELKTEYPFRDSLYFTITVERPVEFPFYIRIPSWTSGTSIVVSGDKVSHIEAGNFYKIEKKWQGQTKIKAKFPMNPTIDRRYNNSVIIIKGPLVYSLKVGEQWKAVHQGMAHHEAPHGDWEIYPTTPWNYALDVSENSLHEEIVFEDKPIGAMPFSPEGAPVVANVKGIRLPQWRMVNGSAGEIPVSPVNINGKLENLTLIPYGCTNLRVTEFPTVR